MGKRAEHWAKNRVFVESRLKIIVMVLADYCNDDSYGLCWPSQSEIARVAGKSVRQVKRDVKDLVELGVMRIIPHRVGRQKTINIYRLHWNKEYDILGHGDNMTPSGRQLSLRSEILHLYGEMPAKANEESNIDHGAERPADEGKTVHKSVDNENGTGGHGDNMAPSLGQSDTDHGDAHGPRMGTPTAPELSTELSTIIPGTNIHVGREESLLVTHWKPDAELLRVYLVEPYEIDYEFLAEQLLDFRAYWAERGGRLKSESWLSKFRKQCVRNLKRRQPDPKPIPADFLPNPATVAFLQDNGATEGLIADELERFVIYWQERGDNRDSWQSVFIQHIEQVARRRGLWLADYGVAV